MCLGTQLEPLECRPIPRPPSYISATTFALSLTEVIACQARKDATSVRGDHIEMKRIDMGWTPIREFEEGLKAMKESHVKGKLEVFLKNSNGNYELLKTQIENWFEEYMERVSGWYRRKTKSRILILSVIATLVLNVDTIDLSERLWGNAVLRESVVAAAEGFAKEYDGNEKDSTLEQKIEKIKSTYGAVGMLGLPIGWDRQSERIMELRYQYRNEKVRIWKGERNFAAWREAQKTRFKFYDSVREVYWESVSPLKLCGWFFTALAVSFGAPFWFEFLKKLLSVRSLIKRKPTGA